MTGLRWDRGLIVEPEGIRRCLIGKTIDPNYSLKVYKDHSDKGLARPTVGFWRRHAAKRNVWGTYINHNSLKSGG